jgi:hypothetical protein
MEPHEAEETEVSEQAVPLKLGLLQGGLHMSVLLACAVGIGILVSAFQSTDAWPWALFGVPAMAFWIAFTLRFHGQCGWRHLAVSSVLATLWAAALIILFQSPFDALEALTYTGLTLGLLIVPGAVALPTAAWATSRWSSERARHAVALACLVVSLGIAVAPVVIPGAIMWYTSSHAELMGGPAVRAHAREMKRTVVVPVLDQAISAGKNIVWCATFQLTWNEACDLIGEDIQMDAQDPIVDSLNEKSVSGTDMDEKTYVAVAGVAGDGTLERVPSLLREKFGRAASPELLPAPGALPSNSLVAYAYLFANLPFEWPFERLDRPLRFGASSVKSFGLNGYDRYQRSEARAAGQILIHDARSEDDFIVELATRRTDHHLYLAKVPPSTTLEETVRAVQKRVAESAPDNLENGQRFIVPIVNFDILRDYDELTGKPLTVSSPHFRGQQIAVASQQIRFRLDERGAILKSEAVMATLESVSIRDLIFDKPFLIMLQYGEAKMPYLAIWVDNAELLVKVPDK